MSYKPATVLGKGIGDSLGAPFEQPNSATEPPERLNGWNGEFLDTHGAYGEFKAGQWTDDTGMAVALANGLLEGKKFDADIVTWSYFKWYQTVPNGLVGGTIKKAMEALRAGGSPATCGVEGSEGNGTAMRCAPIGLFYWRKPDMAFWAARSDAVLTHRSLEAEEGSAAVAGAIATMIYYAINNVTFSPLFILGAVCQMLRPSKIRDSLEVLASPSASSISLQNVLKTIGTRGHVLQTVPAAFACFVLTNSFEEAVLGAVRGGGDADTTAAITGALAGTYYGLDGIPARFKEGVDRGEYLSSLDRRLFDGI